MRRSTCASAARSGSSCATRTATLSTGAAASTPRSTARSRLAFTWIWDGDDTRQLIELDFEESGGVTTVRFTHRDLWDEESVRSHEKGWGTAFDNLARALAEITITPVFVADLAVEGERMPVYVHVIDHPDARVLVDTGMTELHPAMADMDPRLRPLSEQDFDLAGIDIVVNTHLHADHCGGNHLFAGKPFYVQRRELDDARSKDDYTIREWVEAPGVRYVPVDGEHELLPGLRLVPAPGHTPGMQMVVVETGGRPVIVGGDVAVWFGEFDEPPTEGRQRVLALDPELVWLAHEREPWRPRPRRVP